MAAMSEQVSAGRGLFRELSRRQVFRTAALYIAGAAKDVVEFLREAMVQPNREHSFMEPKLPFYDGARKHPAFVQLVEDIEGTDLRAAPRAQ
ncbi:MAG: hypothetical protein AAF358_18305 [Pseudomonadota bacterium]